MLIAIIAFIILFSLWVIVPTILRRRKGVNKDGRL